MNEYEIEGFTSFTREKTRTQTFKHAQTSKIKYDLIGKVADGAILTRKTVAAILQGIRTRQVFLCSEIILKNLSPRSSDLSMNRKPQ